MFATGIKTSLLQCIIHLLVSYKLNKNSRKPDVKITPGNTQEKHFCELLRFPVQEHSG